MKNGNCVCPDGFCEEKDASTNLQCLECFEECKTCSTQFTCITCATDYASPNGTHGCKCNDGYYLLTSMNKTDGCRKCGVRCKTCDNEWSCTECIGNNTHESSGRCICDKGFYYPDDSSVDCIPCRTDIRGNCNFTCEANQAFYYGQCKNCRKYCDECDNQLDCQVCSNKEAPINGLCECPKGSSMKDGKCKPKNFSLELKISRKNQIGLIFDEIPEKKLLKSMLTFETSENNLEFEILYINKTYYSIRLKKRITSSSRPKFTLTIEERPFYSIQGSELKDYTYYSDLNQKNVSEFNKKVGSAMATAAGAAFATAVVSNPASSWILLNSIQLIIYFPLCSIDFSDEMLDFFQGIGSYNAIPDYAKTFIPKNSSEPPDERIQRIGIKTSVFWINFGKNTIALIAYLSLVPILLLSMIFKQIRAKSIKVLKNYKYSLFIRFFIQTYLDIVIFSIIQIISVIFTKPIKENSGYFSYASSCLLIVSCI